MVCLRQVLGAAASANDELLSGIDARSTESGDQGFLRALYASTRADEMRATAWPDSRCGAFLDQQFDFQHRHYRSRHPDALFLLLHHAGEPIGRLYWRYGQAPATDATLIDLSLLPSRRGQGLGSAVLRLLTAEADRRGQVIELHVEPDNPAHRLYRRFGFDVDGDDSLHLKMRRPLGAPEAGHPGALKAASARAA